MTLRILVTDGETRAALACVRSLAQRDCEVHVAISQRDCPAAASRYASGVHEVADPARQPERWAQRLVELARELQCDLVLPLTEVSLGNIFAFGVTDSLAVACPDAEAYLAVVDKSALLERASGLDIDVPRSVCIDDLRELDKLPDDLAYPVVLKSRQSRRFVDGQWLEGGVATVRSAEQLESARLDTAFAGGTLIQEFVPGHGEAVFLLCDRGVPRAEFAHRRLREKPPTGGQSVLRESIQPDPVLLDASRRLLGGLDWHGAAMVEFRRAPDGRAVLMEVNPRLWGSLQLAIDSGVDFPGLLVDLHLGRDVAASDPRIGVRTRWLLGDLDHLLICLRRREVRRGLGRSAASVIWQFLRSFADGTRHEIWRRGDLGPFAAELRGRFRAGSDG